MNHYEAIITVETEKVQNRDMAIANAVATLIHQIPDAEPFGVDTYDEDINDGIPTGIAIDFATETNLNLSNYDKTINQFNRFESLTELSVQMV